VLVGTQEAIFLAKGILRQAPPNPEDGKGGAP